MIGPIRSAGAGSWLVARAAHGMARRALARDPLATRALADDLGQFMWGPLTTLVGLAALVGLIVGIAAARVLLLYNAELLILTALIDAMLRQILPLLVGVFAASGVAVAIATRLGAMTLAREIDALEAMGHDPVPYALGAPLVAVTAASPVHVLVASLAALLGAGPPLALTAHVGWGELVGLAFSDAAAGALVVGMAKAALFATVAFAIGATVGSRPVATPFDMGALAARAFRVGLLAIFAVAALWIALG